MTYPAQTIIKDVQVGILMDVTGKRFPASRLVECLNWAQRVVAAVRWDATASSEDVELVEGAQQALPATAQGLIEFMANAVPPSETVPAGIMSAVRQCKREDLDAIEPNWRARPISLTVKNYTYDVRYPRRFDVYPPAEEGAILHGVLSNYPADVEAPSNPGLVYTTVNGNIGLADEFAPALAHLTAYRAYLLDSEYAANAALAKVHLDAAVAMVGEQLRVMVEATPASDRDQGK